MEYFRTNVKVGAFILVSLILLVMAALTVGKLDTLFAEKHQYTVLVPNANLLPRGAQVSFAGHPVGQVAAITVRSAQERAQQHANYPVALHIVVRASTDIREDSRIELKTNGMIGDRFVDILPGAGTSMPSGSVIFGSLGGLEGLMASLSGVQGGLDGLMTSLNTLLADASRPDSIPGMLASLNSLVRDLQPQLSALMTGSTSLVQQVQQEVGSLGGQAGKTLQGLDAMLSENRPGLKKLISEMNTTMVELQRTLDATGGLLATSLQDVPRLLQRVEALVTELQKSTTAMLGQGQQLLNGLNEVVVENDRNIYTTVENLRDISANVKAMTEVLRANPAALVWGTRGNDGSNGIDSSPRRVNVLQDRGRMGRYDRVR